jgi:hypothetical protein
MSHRTPNRDITPQESIKDFDTVTRSLQEEALNMAHGPQRDLMQEEVRRRWERAYPGKVQTHYQSSGVAK